MDLVNLLDEREQKTVKILATIFGCVFIALLIFGVRARLDAGRMASRRAGFEASWTAADRSRNAAVREWERWSQAKTDIRNLRGAWFYDQAKGVPAMRLDLQKVLEAAGITITGIEYTAMDLVKDRLRRVSFVLPWSGSYPAFRRLLETIESHPRALFISKIDFRDIGLGSGFLEAGIALEGYYVHE